MKQFIACVVALLVGFGIGRYNGQRTAEQDFAHRTVTGVAVDCYDAQGRLVPDKFADLGGVQLECGPGQTATLHGRVWKIVPHDGDTVPVIDAKGFVHEVPKDNVKDELTHGGQIDYDALAKRFGWTNSRPESSAKGKAAHQ